MKLEIIRPFEPVSAYQLDIGNTFIFTGPEQNTVYIKMGDFRYVDISTGERLGFPSLYTRVFKVQIETISAKIVDFIARKDEPK